MYKNFNLSIHHIGGRSGTMEFPYLDELFETNINRVLYDADESCIEQIKTRLKGVILPYCISDKVQSESFYLVADRYASSLIQPKKSKKHFIYNKQFHFDFDLENKIDEIIKINAVSLDSIFTKKNSLEVNAPDYLSLDVEGAELKILKGTKKLLKSNILSIKCEFHDFEECTKLISFCKKYGFYVSNTKLFQEPFKSKEQVNIGLHGAKNGFGMSGDITFCKKHKYIIKHHNNPLLDLLKAAFIAFNDTHLDQMYTYISAFKKQKGYKDFLSIYSKKISYISFLNHFIKALETYPRVKQIKYSILFPKSKDRSNRFKENFFPNRVKIRKKYFKDINVDEFKSSLEHLFNKDHIGIEKVCNQFGYEKFAQELKKDRLADISFLSMWLDLTINKDGNLYLKKDEIEKL